MKLILLILFWMLPTIANSQVPPNKQYYRACFGDSTVDIKIDMRYAKELISHSSARGFCTDSSSLGFFLKSKPFMCCYQGVATYVHESLHGYVVDYNVYDVVTGHKYYYVDSGKIIKVLKYKKTIPSALVLKNYIDQADEFDKVYISSNTTDGIYGLLEELAAYYQEAKFLNETLPTLRSYNENYSFANNLLATHRNHLLAFYKLNVYVANYLKWIKTNDIEFYEFLKADSTVKDVLFEITMLYRNVLNQRVGLLDTFISSRKLDFDPTLKFADEETILTLKNKLESPDVQKALNDFRLE